MARSYIVDDPVKQRFLLDREALVSQSVLSDEMTRIFSKCWIYVGHSSELKKPNEFVTRKVAGRPVIFVRDGRGDIQCFFNTCRHRGAMVCTERAGTRRSFITKLSMETPRSSTKRSPLGRKAQSVGFTTGLFW